MINGIGGDEYNLRLSKTKLLSLEMRRLRSDLIEVFKIYAYMDATIGSNTWHCAGPNPELTDILVQIMTRAFFG